MEESSLLSTIVTDAIGILIIVAIVVLCKPLINWLVNLFLNKALKKQEFYSKEAYAKRKNTLKSIFSGTIWFFVIVIGLIGILGVLGVDTAAMIAGLGVVGFAIGFGSQELIKDMISGTFIIMENQYRVGDSIEIAGVSGTVEEITMRETVLRDAEGHLHHVPNGQITTSTNKSFEFSKIWMNIGVSYDADIEKVEATINKVGEDLAKDKDWSHDIEEAPKFLRVNEFEDSSVEIKVSGRTKPGKQWSVAGEFRKRLLKEFNKEGIEIPYPQRVVHNTKK